MATDQHTSCLRIPVHIQSASDDCLYWSVSNPEKHATSSSLVSCNRKSACCDEKFTLGLMYNKESWTPETIVDQKQTKIGPVSCVIEKDESRILTCSHKDGVRFIGQTDLRGCESLQLNCAGERKGRPVFAFKSCRAAAFLKNTKVCSQDGSDCNLILACTDTENTNAGHRRCPRRISRDYKFNLEIQSNAHVSIMSTWGALLEPRAAKYEEPSVSVSTPGKGDRNLKWTFRFHGEDMYTISAVLRRGRRSIEHFLFYDDRTCDLKLSSRPTHNFPNRGALFKVRPELVQMGKDNVLCFTISQRVRRKEHFLSCKPDGKLAFVHHRGSASKSELFLVFDSWRETNKDGETEKLASQTYSPASLEQLASRTLALACGGGMEGLLCNRTKEWQRQSELQFRGLFESYPAWISESIIGQSIFGDLALESDVQYCKCCGERYESLDPKHNPLHWRYLEVQMRRMNGGTANGSNVSPTCFLKACGVFASFITAANLLRK